MSSQRNPCFENAAQGEVRSWSEDPLTARARNTWTGADYHPIAQRFAGAAEEFVARLSLQPGAWVLDVACGTGNVSLPAARAGARVTGIDLAPNLIARAQREATAQGLAVEFEVGNAESLPYATGQFDVTVSMFGAMFAYRATRAASELVRVTRRGGRIAMGNWSPKGVMGRLLALPAEVVPLSEGLANPLCWSDEDTIRTRFGKGVRDLVCARRMLTLRFPMPPAAVAELFITSYGPTAAALRAASVEGRGMLRAELARVWETHNLASDGNTVVETEYVEVLAAVAV